MEIKNVAYTYLALAIVLGALYPVALYVAGHNGMNIFEFLVIGFTMGSAGSLAFVFLRNKQRKLLSYLLNKKDLAILLFVGLLTHGFTSFGLLYVEQHMRVPLATVIFRMQPLLMLLFLPFILREKVTQYQVAALVLAVLGMSIAITGGSISTFVVNNLPIFGLLIFVTLLDAVLPTIIKRYAYDIESSVFLFNIAALIFFVMIYLSYGAPSSPIGTASIEALAYVGIFFAFNPFFYYGAFRRLKSTIVTNTYFISPFLTFLFSAVLLSQPLYPYYFVVAALTAIGVYIQTLDKKGGTYIAKNKVARQHISIYDVTSAFINTNVDAVHDAMKGSGRVLAVKIDREHYNGIKGIIEMMRSQHLAGKSASLIYTHFDGNYINEKESDFIRDIIGVKDNEVVLMSAGAPETSERVFDSLVYERQAGLAHTI